MNGLTLRGEGVVGLRGGRPGDMIVEVQVQTPTDLSKKQKELFREFDEHCEQKEEGFFPRYCTDILQGRKRIMPDFYLSECLDLR